ncbi:hypothetical protein [Mesorhizobium captivum]|uniref:hypothetical protein n=1 Tax=Mesorhizobium captivum TaxID=3072319 RepID=UPI002A24D9E0|nr:hypothetical protein [Mesorhizobium sp. VK22E]MDX8506139.1 hypothetical protein [Mesorhizobium sp. VK22E]
MSEARPLLHDLIHIPERVQTNDFVLKLSEGVTDTAAAETIKNYVVTPQLAKAFNEALGFIRGSVESGRSAACYLDGSFGSGKSHFMAVLDLLLVGNVKARSIAELANVVTRYEPILNGRRFLMVPYHMIGARDVETAILGGYADHVRHLHPDAPVPGFYLGEKLFEDARRLWVTMGDRAFFAKLNEGKEGGGDGWGDLGSEWDSVSFESAAAESPEGEERQRLVGDLIGTYFSSYADVAAARGEAFLDLDRGLVVMSQHAKRLGYDAVVLFLDELILWLATRAGDVDFVSNEGSKLSKLVEAQRSERPIPIISFVARQRDLRELIGDHHAGALEVRFLDTLKHWEARFDKVKLEDRNLPVIAEKRLLAPVSETARQEIDAEFDRVMRQRQQVLDTLLGSDGERDLFRKVYPFSPALVQALIAASSVLQRERTALKLMLTLLVNKRAELRLGNLIPVGDLWDEIATGDQPFSEGMRIQFENAKKLWNQKLQPLLEQEHNITWQELQEGRADPQVKRRFENDARIVKTLLLAALVPEVPALRALTAPRLAALNHGTVVSPVPGGEGGIVLQKLRSWASRVGEIRISDDQVPAVSLQITGVDVEPILANAAQADNDGTRRTKLQRILFDMLGIAADNTLLSAQPFQSYDHLWRGTHRDVDLYFEVVRELSYERLRGRGSPVLALGMPFDPKGRSPADHLAHARNFNEENASGGIVWQPSHLSDRAMKDLGTLVRIDFLLAGAGDRLTEAARHLSASDREQARAILRSQQSALHQRIRACLEAAYGIRPDNDGCVGAQVLPEDRLVSLDGTFRPQMPVGADMKSAISALLDRYFEHRFPDHPQFESEARDTVLKRVLERVRQAAGEPNQRVLIDDHSDRRHLSAIAVPLKLGVMSQTHLQLSPHWAERFARQHARAGGGPFTVGRLREWMDEPRPMGLQPKLQNLVILAFAAQADRALVRNGAPAQVSLDRIDDAVELKEEALPDEATWNKARERASALFGLVPGEIRKGTAVERLAVELKSKASEKRGHLMELLRDLRPRADALGVPPTTERLVTIRAAQAVVSELVAAADPLATIESLACATLETSEAAVSRLLAGVEDLRGAVSAAPWDIIQTALSLSDHRRAAAEGLREKLAEAMAADEHVMPLRPVLRDIQARATRLLAETKPNTEAPTVSPSTPPPADEEILDERPQTVLDAAEATTTLDKLRERLASEPGSRLTIAWRLTRSRVGGND